MSARIDGNLLLEILEETPANQNIMLMGKHGIGKSQILEKFYSEKGYKVVTLFVADERPRRPYRNPAQKRGNRAHGIHAVLLVSDR